MHEAHSITAPAFALFVSAETEELLKAQRPGDVIGLQWRDLAKNRGEIPLLFHLAPQSFVQVLLRQFALLPQDLGEDRRAGRDLSASDVHRFPSSSQPPAFRL
jgi:hypothetical protein